MAQRHKSAALGRFAAGKKDDDSGDLGDSLDFDNILGGNKKSGASKPASGFGAGGANFGIMSNSTKNTKPPQRFSAENDDSLFGIGSASASKARPGLA